jgi:hypothetical protein
MTSAAAGLAPAGGSGTTKYLRQDGSWQVPPNTTYANMTSAAAGLAPAGGSGTTKYLRQDGSWQVPPNTTYANVSTSAAGLAPKITSTSAFLKGDGTWATPTNTKNTAGSTDTSSKIFLIGATSQAANPQTYSDNEVYTTSGVLTTKSTRIGGGAVTFQYNTNTESVDFIFA